MPDPRSAPLTTHVVQTPGMLLDFLLTCRPGIKKTTVRQWLKFGLVRVNGGRCNKPHHALQPGDEVQLGNKHQAQATSLLPRGLRIVFEDAHLLVIDKPVNLLSVASEGEREKTAYAYLTQYVRGGQPRSRARVWIVHRLDRATSGLMLYAKTEEAQQLLKDQWAEVEKRYLAVVEGEIPDDHGVLDSHLDENSPIRVYVAPPSEHTRRAVTRYRVLRRQTKKTLVELTLVTGRRNQIRVQLAALGCPIVGDDQYGAKTDPVRRLGLHSTVLRFEHPLTGENLRFESPLPKSLRSLV